jgi:alpha-beta hydrolase superfamily lysophospholipase
MLSEIDQSLEYCEQRWPQLPPFLFGQSMGGNLVLNWGLRRDRKVQGIIAAAPMLRPGSPPNPRFVQVGRRLGRWFPNFCMKTPLQVDRLCRDLDAQQYYLSDELVHRQMSLRLGMALLESGEWAIEHSKALRTSTLLLHGNADRLTCLEATKEFAERSKKWSTLQVWDGLRHDLHFEPEWKLVLDHMRRWLANQCLRSRTLRRAA